MSQGSITWTGWIPTSRQLRRKWMRNSFQCLPSRMRKKDMKYTTIRELQTSKRGNSFWKCLKNSLNCWALWQKKITKLKNKFNKNRHNTGDHLYYHLNLQQSEAKCLECWKNLSNNSQYLCMRTINLASKTNPRMISTLQQFNKNKKESKTNQTNCSKRK